jgi:signal transduction histidine kinase
MSLRTKFTLYLSFFILIIILGIAISIFITQKNFLSAQLEENRDRIFKDFAYTCTESLVVKDEIQVFNTIKSVIKTHHPAIVYAGYISPANTVLYSARDRDLEDKFRPRIVKVSRASTDDIFAPSDESIREFSLPVYGGQEYRGTIKAGFSQTYLEEQINEGLVLLGSKIAMVSVIALLVGILLANVLAFYLNKPIRALAQAADDIGEGNLDRKVNITRRDELGRLGKAFNEMARKLKELDELKDGFVSSVSHELRSPLAAIDGYCDYLLEGLERDMTREKQEKSLRIIKEASVRLTNFINNILDLAKIKAGRFELRRMPVDITELATEITSLFESLAHQQQKKIGVDIEGELPSVDADPEKIKQVITNLIGNSLKFTPENAEVRVGARVSPTAPRFVEVWVADTGVGIPQDALDKVFDKFYQVKESEMKKPKGTGLGLAIVAEIIKLHDGKIWVESELNQGSTFKFLLPIWKR